MSKAFAPLLRTVAFRFALAYWLVFVAAMTVIAVVVYVGTIGILGDQVDARLERVADRLQDVYKSDGVDSVAARIEQLLTDNIDQGTEDYLLRTPEGHRIVGNLQPMPQPTNTVPFDQLTNTNVLRYGQASYSRVLRRRLANGDILVVGRDMEDQLNIQRLLLRALVVGGTVSFIIAAIGAFIFRRRLERSVALIRRTALDITAGDLSRRIPIFGTDDEFARLNRDINSMLDRIEHLMEGVRNVSNAIAHDLRTPLGRIRVQLDEALATRVGDPALREVARSTIMDIDDLIVMFDRLLQIAEVESGAGRHTFEQIELGTVINDIVELYDATAEEEGMTLVAECIGAPTVLGDRNLLASALANLIDNAFKYSGMGASVRVGTTSTDDTVSLYVEDDGPGIPPEERHKVIERFYRLDRSRSQPGNGLGLSIVAAIAQLHSGSLQIEDANPGLIARLVLPRQGGIAPSVDSPAERADAGGSPK